MLLGIAAALTLTAFLGGFIYGTQHAPFNEDFAVPMHSTAAGSQAKAVIHVGKVDSAGNWPLKVDVENLPELPKGQYYEMFLSRGADQRAASCGTFRVAGSTGRHPAERAVPPATRFNGWIVTREKPGSDDAPGRADDELGRRPVVRRRTPRA